MINEFKYGQTWKTWPSPLVYHFKQGYERLSQGATRFWKGAAPGLGIHYYYLKLL